MTADTLFGLLQSWWTMAGLLLFGIVGGIIWAEWDKRRARRDIKRRLGR